MRHDSGSVVERDVRLRIEDAVCDFVNEEPTRAVALRSVRGSSFNFACNGDMLMPAASLMKVPLAVALYDQTSAGRLDLGECVRRPPPDVTVYRTVLRVFSEGHTFTLRELCRLMLATSDNVISHYLVDRVGFGPVQDALVTMRAPSTRFVVGFSDEFLSAEGRANITTANDVVNMFEGIVAHPPYADIVVALSNSLRNFRLPLRLPDSVPVAHKTGTLAGVAVDAGIVYGTHHDLAVCFLTDQQSDLARTSVAIGDCLGRIWRSLGERVEM
jgi:beta-lactamase class A